MSISLVSAVLLCVVAFATGIVLLAYGFRAGHGRRKK